MIYAFSRNLSPLYYRTFLDDDLIEKLKLIGKRRSHWMQRKWLLLDIMSDDKLGFLISAFHFIRGMSSVLHWTTSVTCVDGIMVTQCYHAGHSMTIRKPIKADYIINGIFTDDLLKFFFLGWDTKGATTGLSFIESFIYTKEGS